MNFFHKIILFILITTISPHTIAQAEKKPAELSFHTLDLGNGIYMLQGKGGFTGGNLGLLVGKDGVILIDDSMPPMLDIMQQAIASVTDNKPIDFLINTHVHGDHIGNNESLAKTGTHIVAHENLRTHLLEKGVKTPNGPQPAAEKSLPVITFSNKMTFHINGDDAYVFHLPHAHTDGDAVIQFKKANVIHAGDIFFNGMFPFIDLDSGGSVSGYIAAQKEILKHTNTQTKIIPGHGPLASQADLIKNIAVLEECQKLIAAAMKNNITEEELLKLNPLEKFDQKWSWSFITTKRMTEILYRDFIKNNQVKS